MKKRKYREHNDSSCLSGKRCRSTEPLPAPNTLLNRSFLDDTYKLAKEKEREFREVINDFIVPRTVPFLECLDVFTMFYYWIKVKREAMICAIDIFYRYLAKCHSVISDSKKYIGIISACTLLAEKFCGSDEGELDIRDKILETSALSKKELAEAEREVLTGIDYRINVWNGSYFIDYFASLFNYAEDCKEVSLAYMVLIAAHHNRKLRHAKHSLNAAVSFNIATEILSRSSNRGPLKRKRSEFKMLKAFNKVLSSSNEEFTTCKTQILTALCKCKRYNTKIYRILSKKCGSRVDPVRVLERLKKRHKV